MTKQMIIGTLMAVLLVGCSKREELSETPEPVAPRPAASEPMLRTSAPPPAAMTPMTNEAVRVPAAASTNMETLASAARTKFADLLAAFQSADPVTRSNVQVAVVQMSNGQYTPALQTLATVATQPGLTAEQKDALNDATNEARQSATTNAIGDLKSNLPFGK